jgi:hypothetical protein
VYGFASLQAANDFQWSADPGDTLDWMVDFFDRGLSSSGA